MFIRRKIKTINAQSYEQHQLLKSVRTDRGPRQEVVLNMGTLDLPQQQWKALANAIEEQLNNQAPFYFEEGSAEVEKLAAHFAQMIVSKSLNQTQCADQEKGLNHEDQGGEEVADCVKNAGPRRAKESVEVPELFTCICPMHPSFIFFISSQKAISLI